MSKSKSKLQESPCSCPEDRSLRFHMLVDSENCKPRHVRLPGCSHVKLRHIVIYIVDYQHRSPTNHWSIPFATVRWWAICFVWIFSWETLPVLQSEMNLKSESLAIIACDTVRVIRILQGCLEGRDLWFLRVHVNAAMDWMERCLLMNSGYPLRATKMLE